ncbi:MarR family transcriptional regulator [Mycoplasmatota bacterium]|nr:MarR family transcriptional regulator [Mycoplasmatota bacterium]
MEKIKHLNQLYHRIINLNFNTQLPTDMQVFLKLNQLDQNIMNILFETPSMTMDVLRKMLNKSKSTITSALNRLEKQDLIERKQSKEDKRVFHIILTNDGMKLQKAHHMFEYVLFDKILSSLENEREKETFLDLLEKIIKEFEK